ncbi:phosphotransferase [Streptomyces sp. SID2131]|nr:phosphotransferase [Streptomyces sp. SID2131]
MEDRVDWEQLPAELRNEVEGRAGKVRAAERVSTGLNSPAAFVITTARKGRLFFKGIRLDDPDSAEAMRTEEGVNATVAGVSPAIRHSFNVAGWHCLAFVHIDGRHIDLSPGTKDLDALAFVLNRMQRFTGDDRNLRNANLAIPRLVDRFTGFLNDGDADLLSGSSLLHTDTNPHNIMIGTPGGDAYVVDWAMPAFGPAWVDMANTAVRLMEEGQPAADAVAWLNAFPAWQAADPKAVEAYVGATCRQWAARIGEKDAKSSNDRFRQLVPASR